VTPCGPVEPVTPCGPVEPVTPCGPVEPVGPVTPCGPVYPVAPWGPIAAGETHWLESPSLIQTYSRPVLRSYHLSPLLTEAVGVVACIY